MAEGAMREILTARAMHGIFESTQYTVRIGDEQLVFVRVGAPTVTSATIANKVAQIEKEIENFAINLTDLTYWCVHPDNGHLCAVVAAGEHARVHTVRAICVCV
jgi:hypothetical protein